jgi:hypothetical protein
MKKYWVQFQRWNLQRQLAAAKLRYDEALSMRRDSEERVAARATECSDLRWRINHLDTGRRLLSTDGELRNAQT